MTGNERLLYSRGRNINDNRPRQIEVATFDAFIAKLHDDRAKRKDGAAYICGPLNGDGRRCAAGALQRRWIAVDLDRISAGLLSDVRQWFARFSCCVWATHSSTQEEPRERAIIELDQDATRDQCIAVGRVLAHELADKFGDTVLLDESTFRPEQPVFVPPIGVPLARFDGEPLDVQRYLRAAREIAEPAGPIAHPRLAADVPPGAILEGGRNVFLSRRAFALRKQGLNIPDIERKLQILNIAKCEPALSPAEVHAIATGKAKVRPDGVGLSDFHAHMPSHSYLFVPTRELWPATSVNSRVPWPEVDGKRIAPAAWLDKNRPVEQMAWQPAEAQIIRDRVLQVSGWAIHKGTSVFNLYRAPERPRGDATAAAPWVDHVRRVYPEDADHIIKWLAHRVQFPGVKCNHAIVLGGVQGIGKDTLLEPVKAGIGPWNWSDINPTQMLGRFNGWAKAVIVRVSEARDLGDVDRFAFYDHSKTIIAAPPDVLRVDEKHLREHYVANVCGVVITTNHASDGLYLPADDRRHFVAWSPRVLADFEPGYWMSLYAWFKAGGIGHVCAYLAALDLSGFDAKEPPPKTPAFWQIVTSSEAPESGELRDLIERLGEPDAITLGDLIRSAVDGQLLGLAEELRDRKTRRTLPHRLERVGYVPVRNPDAEDRMFRISGRRQVVYSPRKLTLQEQVKAARGLA